MKKHLIKSFDKTSPYFKTVFLIEKHDWIAVTPTDGIPSNLHFEYWFWKANMHRHEHIHICFYMQHATFLCVYTEIRCIHFTHSQKGITKIQHIIHGKRYSFVNTKLTVLFMLGNKLFWQTKYSRKYRIALTCILALQCAKTIYFFRYLILYCCL